MPDEPKLVIPLEARLDKFEKNLQQAGVIAEREVAQIERAFTGRDFAAGIAQGMGQEFTRIIQDFVKQIPKALDEVAKIGDLSEVLGVSTDQIQVMRFALEQSGGTAQQADAAMQKFADTVVDAGRGAGQLAKWFEANNVAVKNADGSMRSVNALLAEMARLIQGARSPQEALNLATDAFGRSAAPAMVRALKEGATGLAEFEKEAREAGVVLEKSLIAQAKILDDEFTKLMSTISALAKRLAVDLAGSFREALKTDFDDFRRLSLGVNLLEQSLNNLQLRAPWISAERRKELEDYGIELQKIIDRLRTPVLQAGFAPRTAREGVSPLAELEGATRITVTPLAKETAEAKTAVERLNEQMSKTLEISKAELATVGQTIAQREKARVDALLTEAMKRDQLTTETAITQEIRRQAGEEARIKQQIVERTAQMQELAGWSKEFGSAMSDALKGMVLQGKSFNDVLKSMSDRLASKAFDKLFDVIFASPAGGGSSSFLKLFGLQHGGPARAGQAYVVGERGPELFVPNRSGVVVPNTRGMGAAGGATMNVSNVTPITIEGSADARTIGVMQAMLEQSDRRFIADVARANSEIRRRSVFA